MKIPDGNPVRFDSEFAFTGRERIVRTSAQPTALA